MYVLDDKDRALLAELQRDSRQTVQQLATAVGLSATPCWKRVKDMEAAGVIRGYGATIDRESVGLAPLGARRGEPDAAHRAHRARVRARRRCAARRS